LLTCPGNQGAQRPTDAAAGFDAAAGALTKVTLASSVSVTITLPAGDGPKFVTEMV